MATLTIWTRAKRAGVLGLEWVRAAYGCLAPSSGPPGWRREELDVSETRAIVLGEQGAPVGQDAANSAAKLARMLRLTLLLRDAYKDHYWNLLPTPLVELRLMCGEHGRRQTELARRLKTRLVALGTPASEAPHGVQSRAPLLGETWQTALEALLSSHRAMLREAGAFMPVRPARAWTTEQELVVADVAATNRRQSSAIVKWLAAHPPGTALPSE